jgi:hypothetical protein
MVDSFQENREVTPDNKGLLGSGHRRVKKLPCQKRVKDPGKKKMDPRELGALTFMDGQSQSTLPGGKDLDGNILFPSFPPGKINTAGIAPPGKRDDAHVSIRKVKLTAVFQDNHRMAPLTSFRGTTVG